MAVVCRPSQEVDNRRLVDVVKLFGFSMRCCKTLLKKISIISSNSLYLHQVVGHAVYRGDALDNGTDILYSRK